MNGDGVNDAVWTRTIADTGVMTEQSARYSSTGALQSLTRTVTSDDGLSVTEGWDRDGDGIQERRSIRDTVLNANGSTTTMTTGRGANDPVYVRSTVTVSDDRLTTTRADDVDGDGTTEFTQTQTRTIAVNGVVTDTVQTTSENNSLINRSVTVTSADGRTVTQSTDLDGNGVNDRQTVTTIANSGTTTSTTTYFSTGGAVEGRFTRTTSADGLVTTTAHDTNGDGRADLSSTDRTTLSVTGEVSRSVTYTNERNQIVGQEQSRVSDDGNRSTVMLDLNGDQVFEFRTDTTRSYSANGDVVVRQVTKDATDDSISDVLTTTSGNGLRTTVVTDFTGDGNADRNMALTRAADGGWVETNTLYYPGSRVTETTTRSQSADGRTLTTTRDLNGDGKTDRSIVAVTDLSSNLQVDYKDVRLDNSRSILITEKVSANGMDRSFTFDVDNDNKSDFARFTDVTFNADGSTTETFREIYEANQAIYGTYGAKRVVYSEVTTTSANGLQSTTRIDTDGDGVVDATTSETTTIGLNGSRTVVSETRYADNDLRSRFETVTSADGRTSTSTADYDGNGIADKITESRVLADGSRQVIDTSFGQGGTKIQTFVTTTSADGLVTRMTRGNVEQVITRSAVDPDSYTWTNGVTASTTATNVVVTHQIDALGIETWTMTSRWISGTTPQVSVSTVRLDAAAKDRVLAEAARIFDTILDRDMDVTEIEMLVPRIANGQLDELALATDLLASSEFATRYGTLSNAEFVTQIYLNALGRVPSLVELSDGLSDLATGAISRAKFAAGISEGMEHVVVGNGHLSTNNFDVIMNPAVFERSLDEAYVRNLVESLVDVVYDRDATAQEMTYLTGLMLKGTDNPDDIATKLLGVWGGLQGVASNSLFGLTGANLVKQGFVNALGRQPTAQEQAIWEAHLSTGRITVAQFVASLAQSMDHMSVGVDSAASVLPTVTTLNGTIAANALTGTAGHDLINGLEGNGTIAGGDGSDRIVGGTGADLLWGGATTGAPAFNGSDTYVWAKGDGSDEIRDWSQSLLETDTLELTNVASTEVTLSYSAAVGFDLLVTVVPTGEVIRIDERYQNAGAGFGIERIVFSDGVVWNLEDILQRAQLNGDAVANTLNGTGYQDNIYGLDGNDTLNGGDGNDVLYGGTGLDALNGGNGSDAYYWQRGHGGDSISDVGASLTEVDTLYLTDVLPNQLRLQRLTGSADLRVDVYASGVNPGDLIRIVNQFPATDSGSGIERIVFANGVVWNLRDILARTVTPGAGGNDLRDGTSHDDYIDGNDGNDTINGLAGDDRMEGGAGNDVLDGGAGSDLYEWAGQGSDTINDTGTSLLEVDHLRLRSVLSSVATLTRANGSNNLAITLSTGETFTITNRFLSATSGVGIERISFMDGVIWDLQDILARTSVNGTAGNDALTGVAYRDNLYGLAGNDTLTGNDGDDVLVGGTGVDSLVGGNGSDIYQWTRGDGGDSINEAGATAGEVDTLVLTDVASSGAVLARSGANLTVTVPQSGEVITVLNRFATTGGTAGVEVIEFSDGVVTRIVDDQVALFSTTGTANAEVLTGTAYRDMLSGLAGNDTLIGGLGDDRLIGGLGADVLWGDANGAATATSGSDAFVWAKGDGNDTINDWSQSLTEIDTLQLTNVTSNDVALSYSNSAGADLLVRVISTGEIIRIDERYQNAAFGYGIERISFADGVFWDLEEILRRSQFTGTTAAETLNGTAWIDNMSGLDGNDVLNAGNGDDVLIGGLGADALAGGNGSDRYEWTKGHGNDTINDAGASLTEVDTLVLTNVTTADGIRMNRVNGSTDLTILIESTNETIRVAGQYTGVTAGNGIERIVFADGLVWQLDDILDRVRVSGGSTNDNITGTAFDDNMWGFLGNDTLTGGAGNDSLQGGEGNDVLDGGAGDDFYFWRAIDGSETISDTGTSIYEYDLLKISSLAQSAVNLYRLSSSSDLRIEATDSAGVVWTQIVRNQFLDPNSGVGLEGIEFADGTIWTREDILERTGTYGTGNNNNHFIGTASRDRMFGRLGSDTLDGGAGNDLLVGGQGADSIYGGAGVDRVSYYDDATQGVIVDLRVTGPQVGNPGGDEVGDILLGVEDLDGTFFNDQLTGDNQSNYIAGGEGADIIYGMDGYDQIRGGSGFDTIYGGDGADDIRGDHNSDSLFGGAGGDTIEGGSFNDQIFGGTGDDFIIAGTGIDVLWGEQGSDTFLFTDLAFQTDTVMDFEDGIDRLWFAPAAADDLSDLTISGNGTTSVTIALAANTIVLNSATAINLAADDFLFA